MDENTPWTVLILGMIGAVGLLYAVNAALWYVAHHLAWWTFALATTGFSVAWITVKETVKELRS